MKKTIYNKKGELHRKNTARNKKGELNLNISGTEPAILARDYDLYVYKNENCCNNAKPGDLVFDDKTGTCTRKVKKKDLEIERTNTLANLRFQLEEKAIQYQREQLTASITGEKETTNLKDLKDWYNNSKAAIEQAKSFEELNNIQQLPSAP